VSRVVLRRNPLSQAIAVAFGHALPATVMAMPDPLTPNQRAQLAIRAQAPHA
jgi:hypothetical protein